MQFFRSVNDENGAKTPAAILASLNKTPDLCSSKKHSVLTRTVSFSLPEKVSSGKHFFTAQQTEKQDGSPHILPHYEVTVACQRGMMHRTRKGRVGTVGRWHSGR